MNLLSGTKEDHHRPQKNPGAYEWWHFDAEDPSSGHSLSLEFHAGNLFSPFYQENLKAYWGKTRSPLLEGAPALSTPDPLDFCGLSFRLFHQGSLLAESLQEFPRSALKASDRQGAVLLGANRFNWDGQGDPPSYVVTIQAPLKGGRNLLRARLFYTPLCVGFPELPRPELLSTHTWVLAAPLCHVEGTIEWCDGKGDVRKEQALVGNGSHDHHFGTVPLERFVRSWHWGRALSGDRSYLYSARIPADPKEAPEGLLGTLAGAKMEGFRRTGVRLGIGRRNFFLLPFDKELVFEGEPGLTVRHRRILADGPASLVFEDEVRTPDGKSLQGLSHYVHAPRLAGAFTLAMLKGKSLIVKPQDPMEPPPGASGDVTTTRPPI